jgi:type IV pilus assembly protein PilM
MLDRLKSLVKEPPPATAFEISEAGIAAARVGSGDGSAFRPFKPGTLEVSPLKENVLDAEEFSAAVRAIWAEQGSRKHRDVAVILPDFCTRMAVLDFDDFPADAKEQISLVRFRLKRSVPFDVEAAAVSYWAQHPSHKTAGAKTGNQKCDVLAVLAPFEIVARYEAPFRAAGMNPGLVTTSTLAALELAPAAGLNVFAKITGRVLTVVVRESGILKLVRCLEVPSQELEDVASVLLPTFVYVEDNWSTRADSLFLCGFGAQSDNAQRHFEKELGVTVELVRSPWGMPGETNAGLLGFLQSVAKN